VLDSQWKVVVMLGEEGGKGGDEVETSYNP
jgi:hypothetical protein